jgi:hypothetical protein
MIMLNCISWLNRHEHDVEIVEELFPLLTNLEPTLMIAEPVTMTHCSVALDISEWRIRTIRSHMIKFLARVTTRERRVQKALEYIDSLFKGEAWSSPGIHRYPCSCQSVGQIGKHTFGVAIDRVRGVIDPCGDTKVASRFLAGRWKIDAPAWSIPSVRPGEDIHCEFEVIDMPSHWAGDGDIGLTESARHSRNLPV